MTRIDPALEAAIATLSAQPGVAPDQVDRLRTTILSDQELHGGLSALASRQQLRAFRIAPSSEPAPAGRFDPDSGVINIPASALAGSDGSEASGKFHGVLRVQRMIGDLSASAYPVVGGQSRPVSTEMIRNFQAVLNESPALASEIKRAATTVDPVTSKGYLLEKVSITKSSSGLGGAYQGDDRSMTFPSTSLMSTSTSDEKAEFKTGSLTFVVGHEIQHAFDRQDAERAKRVLIESATQIAKSDARVHDYTGAVKSYLQATRDDEARAEIAGWNAVHSRLTQKSAAITPEDMLLVDRSRMGDFVDSGALSRTKDVMKSNLEVNKDLTLPMSAKNIAAMGENYYDRPPPAHIPPGNTKNVMALGDKQVDYPNHYGRYPVEIIAWAEANAPKHKGPMPSVALDMAGTGLWEDLLEENGLNLSRKESIPYVDGSHRSPNPRFDHTMDGPSARQSVPLAAPPSDPWGARLESPLHRELRNALPAAASEDRIAQVATAAKLGGIEAGGIRTMDIVGERLLLTGKTPGTNASIDLATPPPPVEQSNAQFGALVEQQRSQAQQPELSKQQSGPSMLMGR